jgi:hypothetical protein
MQIIYQILDNNLVTLVAYNNNMLIKIVINNTIETNAKHFSYWQEKEEKT